MFDAVGRLQGRLVRLRLLLLFLLHQAFLFVLVQGEELLLGLSVLLVHGCTSLKHTNTELAPRSSCAPAVPSSRTFLRVLDDLPDGFLQAVGSQHQLLSWFEDGGGRRRGGAGARRAGGMVMEESRRRQLRGRSGSLRGRRLGLLLLLGDGRGRGGVRHAGGLRLLVQRLQQRVQLLLQHAALTPKQRRHRCHATDTVSDKSIIVTSEHFSSRLRGSVF